MSIDLGIESGLDYIASQNLFECFYDTMQNIFLNADGFREIFAYKAQELANNPMYNRAFILNQINADLCEDHPGLPPCADILAMFGLPGLPEHTRTRYINAFFDLIVAGMRRYVLIKLLERGYTEAQIKRLFGIHSSNPGLQTACSARVPKFRTWYISGRRPSINCSAGSNIALKFKTAKRSLETASEDVDEMYTGSSPYECVGWSRPGLEAFFKRVMKIPLLDGRFEVKSFAFDTLSKFIAGYVAILGFETIYSNISSLVAIYYHLEKKVEYNGGTSSVHKVAIIRYRGQYFYCDNELGRAIPIDRAVFLANCNNTLAIYEERVTGSLGGLLGTPIGRNSMENITKYKVTLGPATIYEASVDIPHGTRIIKNTFITVSAHFFIQKAAAGGGGGGGGAAAGGGGGGGGAMNGGRRRRRQTRRKN